jgi:hypothetical protein
MIFRPIRAWNRFWFAPVSARPLGAFRILYGAIAVANIALLLGFDLDYWFTSRGIFQPGESAEIAGPLRQSFLHAIQDPFWVRVVLWSVMASAVGLMVGWHTRLMSILYYVGIVAIHHRNVATASGADVLVAVIAFYLMLSPCGAAYSLDARRAAKKRGWTEADPLIMPWAQRLIQIQVCVVYLASAILKISGPAWVNGTALHYVLCNSEVGRFDLAFLAGYPLLVNVLTYGALVIELSLGLFLWSKRARPWVIVGGISLHVGILFLVNIPIFGEAMTACYICFLTSGEWESLRARFNPLGRLAQRLGRFSLWSRYRLRSPNPFGSAAATEIVNARAGSA